MRGNVEIGRNCGREGKTSTRNAILVIDFDRKITSFKLLLILSSTHGSETSVLKQGAGRMSIIAYLLHASGRYLGFSLIERVADDMASLNRISRGYDISGKQIAICDIDGKGVSCQ